MTKEASTQWVQRKRYRVAAGENVPVAIQRFGKDDKAGTGALVDISASGARILCDSPLRFGEKVNLHIESTQVGLSISIGCEVRWIRGGVAEQQWTAGCLFEQRLDEALLETHIEDGLLERRQSNRHTVMVPATVKFEGVGGCDADVDLHSISEGGCCILSPVDAVIGTRARITLEDFDFPAVEGRIMWQADEDGEFSIGCEWLDRKGAFLAKRVTQELGQVPDRKKSRLGDHLVGTALVAVVAFFLGVMIASVSLSHADPAAPAAESRVIE